MPQSIAYEQGRGLCAYLGAQEVYRTTNPAEVQAIFGGIGCGLVVLGIAVFTGDSLRYVAREAAKAWLELSPTLPDPA